MIGTSGGINSPLIEKLKPMYEEKGILLIEGKGEDPID